MSHLPRFPSFIRLVLFFFAVVAAVEARAEAKIGTVDMGRVLNEYHKTKEAEAKLNDATSAAKKEFEERAEAYKKELEEINKLNSQLDAPALSTEAKTLKAKERDEKIAKLKNMEREMNEFRQTREQQLQQQMLRLRETIVKEITDVVIERGKARNLDIVLDKSGISLNRFSAILFSPDSMDFSEEVILELNKKGSPPSPAAVKSPTKP